MRRFVLALCLVWPLSAQAQSLNSNQVFQPFSGNFISRTSGADPYTLGAPGHGGDATGVLMQWMMDESSGAIVDEVSSISLSVSGSPTFGVLESYPFNLISPGITYDANSEYHQKLGADANCQMGNINFTVEFMFSSTSGSGNRVLFDTRDSTNLRGFRMHMNYHTNTMSTVIRTELDTDVSPFSGIPSGVTLNDGNVHKGRITFDRSGSASFFFDGVAAGTSSISAADGEDINCNAITMGNEVALGNHAQSTIYGLRISTGLTANFGGPGGG